MSMFESLCVGAGGREGGQREGEDRQTGDPHLDTVIRYGPVSGPGAPWLPGLVASAVAGWGAPEERGQICFTV